jgi:hypothetical protein
VPSPAGYPGQSPLGAFECDVVRGKKVAQKLGHLRMARCALNAGNERHKRLRLGDTCRCRLAVSLVGTLATSPSLTSHQREDEIHAA